MVEFEKGKRERYSMSISKMRHSTSFIKYIHLVLCVTLLVISVINSNAQGFRVIEGIPHLPVVDPMSISSPKSGMMIYSTEDNCPMIFTGLRWGGLCDNKIDTETTEDYFVVKEGIPFVPIKTTVSENAKSGTLYYSIDIKSMMIYTLSGWVKITDLSKSNFVLRYNFETESGNIRTWVLPVLDKDPTSSKLQEGAFYINSVSKSIRYLSAIDWKDINCIPEIKTLDITNVTDVNTASGGNIISNSGSAIVKRGICWDVYPSPDITLNTKTVSESVVGFDLGEYPEILTNLMANTTYYVRAYAINNAGVAYGEEKSFKTTHGIPEIITQPITDIKSTTATSGGNIRSNGGSVIQGRGICWSSAGDPKDDSNAVITNDGSGVGIFPSDLVGLMGDTKYYVRAFAYNRYGKAYGNLLEFNTLPPVLPILSTATLDISDITGSSAVGAVTVLNNGGSLVTEAGVCWSTDRITYHKVPSDTKNPTDIGTFISNMTGLNNGTLYYVKGYATNGVGTSYSSETSFITTSLPELTTLEPNVISGTEAVSGAEITNNGNADILSAGVCWSINENPTISEITKTVQYPAAPGTGKLISSLTDLIPGTTYHVRAYAKNIAGVAYGEDKVFKTNGIPEIITLPISEIKSTTASGGGDIKSNGGSVIQGRGICWSSIGDPKDNPDAVITNDGSGVGVFPSDLVGLMGKTKYYVRAYAYNRYGKAYGNLVEFISQPSVPPVLSTATLNITDITNSTAVGTVTVLNNGGSIVIERGICWSSDRVNYHKVPSSTINPTDIGTFISKMTGLKYGTLYYVKGYATNIIGTSYSSETSFITTSLPELTTLKPTEVAGFGAKSGGEITNNGDTDILSAGVCWSTNRNASVSVSTKTVQYPAPPGTGVFTSDLKELEPDTKYYFRAYATNEYGTAYGNLDSLVTAALPKVTTDEIISITNISAESGGTVVSDGRQFVSSRGICWGTIENPSISDNYIVNGTGIGSYIEKIEGLMGNTTYYVRAYAINSVGVAYGESKSFKTAPPILAELTTGSAYDIGGTTAWCRGHISKNGGAEIISRGLCWSTNPEFDPEKVLNENKAVDDNVGIGGFSCKLTGLTPNTKYYVRAFATNSVGTEYGNRVEFSTFTVPSLITSPVSQITNTTATGGGNISSDGGAIVTRSGICWSTNENPTLNDKYTSEGIGIGSFIHEIKDLMGSTTYYVRAYAINNAGLAYGNQVSFVTGPPVLSTLTTIAARSGESGTTIICGGNVESNGGAIITSTGLCCSTVPGFNPETETEFTIKQNGSGSFTGTITGLTPGTKYYIKAYVENSVGKAYAINEVSVVTFNVPKVKTISPEISSISSIKAICGGDIIDNGGAIVTSSGICWSTIHNPEISGSKNNVGVSLGSFKSTINNLLGSKTYYVRAYAINSVGLTYGNEISFTTLPPVLATLTTNQISCNSESTAISGGNISSNGGAIVTTRGIYWSTQAGFTPDPSSTNKTEQTGYFPNNYESILKDLVPNTIYYVKAYVENIVGIAYGNEVSFRMPDLPKVTTKEVYAVQITSAWSGGTVIDDGGAYISSKGIIWSTDPSFKPTLNTENKIVSGSGSGVFSSKMSQLKGNTTYYVRAFATNLAGTTFGNLLSYKTDPCTIPTLTTRSPSYVTGSTVISGGDVSDDGGDPVKDFGVIWSTTENFVPNINSSDKTSQSRIGTRSFSSNVSNLKAGTTYYLRAYAKNGEGVAYGNQVSFTTLDKPKVETSKVSPSSTGRAATGGGVILSNGGADIRNQGVCWGIEPNPTTGLYTKTTYDKLSGNKFSSVLNDLEPVTTYYVRAYAYNSQGTSYGENVEFTTLPALPTLSTNYVVILSTSSVVSGGDITDDGGAQITERGVLWSETSTFNPDTVLVNRTSDGTGIGNYRSEVTGLDLSVTYFIRAYAKNSAGVAYGNQVKVTIFPTAPRLKTVAVTDTTGYSGLSGGIITSDGGRPVTLKGLCWSKDPNPVIINNPCKTNNGTGTDSFVQKVTGLEPNTLYYVRAYAVNKIGTAYGEEMKVLTHAFPTITATTPVTDIIATTATSGGNVTDDGRTPIISRGICWSRYNNPTVNLDTKIVEDNNPGIGSFVCHMTGLIPETKYYVRSFATNSVGTNYGSQVYFTTNAVMLPSLTTHPVSAIQSREALSGGNVSDDGGMPVTDRGICWNTENTPTVDLVSKTNDVSGGIGDYTNVLAGLMPHTKYYVRAYATNFKGTAYGNEVSFTTECIEPELSLVTISDINMISAKGVATIVDNGGTEVTECGLYINTGDTIAIPPSGFIVDVDNDDNINGLIENLKPNTKYYAWAYAVNRIGKAYSATPVEFSTPTLPTLTTNRPTEVTDTTAICGGRISDEGGVPVLKRGVCWGATITPDIKGDFIEHTDGGAGDFSVKVEDLLPGVKYYVRAFAINSMGLSYGNLDSITTLNVPILTTTIHKDVTIDSAISGGDIIEDGGRPVVTRGVCWDTLTNPTATLKTKTIDGTGIGEFVSNITNLKRVTKYYIRAYATNSVGTGYGKLDSIITLPDLPTVSNVTMSSMVNGSSDGTAEVLDDGGAEVTERGLCLSTKGDPEVTDETIIVGSGLGSFTGVISGLIEGPTYYIRAYATNRAGSAYSEKTLSFKICPSEFDVIHTAGLDGAPESKTVTYHSVSTDISGAPMCWLTQNLGADQEATSFDDATEESAGWYWQFNRKQGYKHDGTARTPNLAYVPWISRVYESRPWYAYNDPCNLLLGLGWRIPTRTEWTNADGSPQNWANSTDTYNSVLKLHYAGYLHESNGSLVGRGTIGLYWTSTGQDADWSYYFDSNGSGVKGAKNRANAYPLRCIRDTLVISVPSVSNVVLGKMTSNSAEGSAVVSKNGGSVVTAKGLCWNTEGTPTIENNVVQLGDGVGDLNGLLETLEEGPTYFVRAYATNEKGTAYSSEVTSFKICPSQFDVIHTAGLNGSPVSKTVTYHSVSSKMSGKSMCWLTQNLGADRQATSAIDAAEESAGWYWQFNRKQGYKHDGITRTPNLAYVPWIAKIRESGSWIATNDPCNLLLGLGWRIPTRTEWTNADAPPQNWINTADTYSSVLKLHSAGYLHESNGSLVGRGTTGLYWTSTGQDADWSYFFNSSGAGVGSSRNRANAYPLRCIRDTLVVSVPSVSNVVLGVMTSNSAEGSAVVSKNGGSIVTAKGLCWNTEGTPTIENNVVQLGGGVGDLNGLLETLEEGPTYFVRAYATNEKGTAYSPEVTSFKICPSEFKVIHTAGLNGAPVSKTVTYHSVSSKMSGKSMCWLTQNLGADRQATSATDATEEAAGWYWQFNRKQGYKHDGKIRTPNLAYVPWLSRIRESGSWSASNDPCNLLLGLGWRIPTRTEWTNADAPPQNWTSQADTYNSILKLHSAGYLAESNGSLASRGTIGYFWTSTGQDADWSYFFNSNGAGVGSSRNRANAYPLRCLRDNVETSIPVVSDVTMGVMTSISAEGSAVVATNGGATVTERGLCWNTSGTPTIDDNVIPVGDKVGSFSTIINGLEESPTYYVRAYATNTKGTAYSQNVTSFKICPSQFDVIHTAGLNGAPVSKTVTYHSVSSNMSGSAMCWLTQNLGADKQATSLDDASEEAAGWYWQFNRKKGYKHDGTTRTPNLAYEPWIRSIRESASWSALNDPCSLLLGLGWRIPTRTEWTSADAPPQNWRTRAETYNSVLKLHSAGYLAESNGTLASRGTIGYFWTSTGQDADWSYYFNTDGKGVCASKNRAYAFPLRCIRDEVEFSKPLVSNVELGEMTATSAKGTSVVTFNGGQKVTERGLCWNTTGNPTIDKDHIQVGDGLGSFIGTINGLEEGPTYYVRAYATNKEGTSYSPSVSTFKICPSTFSVIHTAGLNGAPESKTVNYHSISSNMSGSAMCWLTQNLGADREAETSNDLSVESAGWYWQFNRKQGYNHDGKIRTPNLAYVPWITKIRESSSWIAANDPCNLLLGLGWRIPTSAEWTKADAPPQNWTSQADTYNSVLKLHSAGYLAESNGSLASRGTIGYFWTSTGQDADWSYYFNSNGAGVGSSRNRAFAYSLRCIRDEVKYSIPVVSNVELGKMTSSTAQGISVVATNGGATVTERGFCWNTTGNPTIANNVVKIGNGLGEFSDNITGLKEGPTYYVRAYATNKEGTGYSPIITTFKICPSDFDVIHTAGLNGAPVSKTVTYHSVSSNMSGNAMCWLTQNLGADEQATSINDATERSAGWYWQFNRKQGYKYDGTTRTPNLAYVPWLAKIRESGSWSALNDPCNLLLGLGWRIPTRAEWISADAPPQNWTTAQDSYNSVLKLHSAGYLAESNGVLAGRGTTGLYWTSTGQDADWSYFFNSSGAGVGSSRNRAFAYSLRCIRDKVIYSTPKVSDVILGTMTSSTAQGTATIATNGGAEVTERGLCWNTSGNPTVADKFIKIGIGLGEFSDNITGLIEGPTYYVRAYAKNAEGTAYSPNVSTFKICPSEFDIIHKAGLNGAPVSKTVTYHSVSSNMSGAARCWLTQNLGANRQAISANDASEESAGWYWQFNRKQGFKNDGSTRTPNLTYIPWQSRVYENRPWYLANDPCNLLLGLGWRIPTATEWTNADAPPQNWTSAKDSYNSVLKLHAAGYLNNSNGVLVSRGSAGLFWTSTGQDSDWSYFFNVNGTGVGSSRLRAYAYSLRCIRDEVVLTAPHISNAEIIDITTSSAKLSSVVSINGGKDVVNRGLCWNTTGNPTISDNVVNAGNGLGEFTSDILGLVEGPTYYVRAFATNEIGTVYSPEVKSFRICPLSFQVEHKEGENGAPESKTVTYHSLSSVISGVAKCWLTQNLGADRQASSSTDASEAAAGWYWQFNRKQGYKNTGSTLTPSSSWIPRVYENTYWSISNDPCRQMLGEGWRIPTSAEWTKADAAPQNWLNSADTYNSILKLHSAGYLYQSNGALIGRGSEGRFWTSTGQDSDWSYYFKTNGEGVKNALNRAFGQSIRCIKD